MTSLPELDAYPRARLMHAGDTPVEKLPAMGNSLGISLSVKRDDCTSFAFGGNKVRQLEYYFGEALAQNADCLLITGAVQSNFVRTAVAAARKLGLEPFIQLEDRVPMTDDAYQTSGNVFLDEIFGADIRRYPDGEDEAGADRAMDELGQQLAAAGRRPYVVHLSMAHPPIGGLGYVNAGLELARQVDSTDTPDHVVVPSGSGLTHAGLLVGIRAAGWQVPVSGICVRRDAKLQRQRIAVRAAELCAMIGRPGLIGESDVEVDDCALLPGYGQLNDATREAVVMAARQEGMLLDPVYSGRTMAGLIKRARTGAFASGAHVLFVHTGGLAALFAYQNVLLEE
jgi:D-cysteine desulfhydrase family pyridoxal phosphate-dependent enzyme